MTDGSHSLWQQINSMPAARHDAQGMVYQAVALPGHRRVYLAKDESGSPLFLVNATDAESARSVRLAQLRVAHGIRARVESQEEGGVDGEFSIIECRAAEEPLQRLFLECISNALPHERESRSAASLNRLISHLVALFASASAAPSQSPAGLWGELFILSLAEDVPRMAHAWHQMQEEHFDFAEAHVRLEVKTSQSHDRRHSFSLEQANPADGIHACVASLVTEPAAGELTVGRLRLRCLAAVGSDADLRAKIDRLCMEYLGAGWEEGLEQAFDEHTARESLRLYDVRAIPRITAPAPPGVTNVRFTSCLSIAEPVPPDNLAHEGFLSLVWPPGT